MSINDKENQQDTQNPEVLENQDENNCADSSVKEELSEMESLQNDFAALNDRYLRLVAEYDNFRKRSIKERECIYPEAVASTVCEFLPLIDNFGRALAVECADENYKKGIEITFNSLKDTLTKLRVEEFGDAGDAFDPNIHDAVMHTEDDTVGPGTVVEVFKKGYKVGDRVLRFAMVKAAN